MTVLYSIGKCPTCAFRQVEMNPWLLGLSLGFSSKQETVREQVGEENHSMAVRLYFRLCSTWSLIEWSHRTV